MLALDLRLRLLRFEEPEEECSQRCVPPDSAFGLRLEEPAPNLVEARTRQGIRLRPPRPGFRLLDQAVLEKSGKLGVDLAVARRPGVGERLLEVLEQLVAGARLFGKRHEECVLQRHVYVNLDMYRSIGHHSGPCGCRACSSRHSPWSRSSPWHRLALPPRPRLPTTCVSSASRSSSCTRRRSGASPRRSSAPR